MPVTADRSGNTVTITITLDATTIVANAALDARGKRLACLQVANQSLADAYQAVALTDAQIDAQAAQASSTITALKTARPTGTL